MRDLLRRARSLSDVFRKARRTEAQGRPSRIELEAHVSWVVAADLIDELINALAPPVSHTCSELPGGCYMFPKGTPEHESCRSACLMIPRLGAQLSMSAAMETKREELRDHLLQLMTVGPVIESEGCSGRQNLISYAHGYALALCQPRPAFQPLIVAAILVKLTTELTELSNAENTRSE